MWRQHISTCSFGTGFTVPQPMFHVDPSFMWTLPARMLTLMLCVCVSQEDGKPARGAGQQGQQQEDVKALAASLKRKASQAAAAGGAGSKDGKKGNGQELGAFLAPEAKKGGEKKKKKQKTTE